MDPEGAMQISTSDVTSLSISGSLKIRSLKLKNLFSLKIKMSKLCTISAFTVSIYILIVFAFLCESDVVV